MREGISDLRIYVAVTSPYPQDRGVTLTQNMTFVWGTSVGPKAFHFSFKPEQRA